MKVVLKPLKDQIIVITGATNGVGLATAKKAAYEGAKIVIASNNEAMLRIVAEDINNQGGKAVYVKADVGKEEDVTRIANTAIRAYGTFDTWINNADVSVEGGCLDVSIEDLKRMFDTNFWGVIFGSRIAADHFTARGEAGAIINVSSFSEERSSTRHAPYSMSMRAINEWTDALRAELEREKRTVSVSLIHLGKVDSLHNQYSGSNFEKQFDQYSISPIPEGASRAILHCAEKSKRDLYVNSQSKFFTVLDSLKPKFTEKTIDFSNQSTFEENFLDRESRETHQNKIENSKQAIPAQRSFISTILLAGLGASIWMLTKRKDKSINEG
jgi:NAD(P)-dependent dehydrogenase (short-subunit alcohol dehydrogenase family)